MVSSARSAFSLSVLLALVWVTFGASWAEAQPGARDEASPVTAVTVVKKQVRETVPLSGTSIPWRKTLLSPQVDGMVTTVPVEAGTWVEAGDRVVTLDSKIAAIDVAEVEALLQEARVRLRDARRKREELKRLIADRHVSETSLESAIAEVEAAEAVVKRRQADLDRRRELLRRHEVKAPFAGMVTRKMVEQGQWAQTDTDLVELVAVETIRVSAPLPQRFYPRVPVGARARVSFEAMPGRVFDGVVFAKVAAGNEVTRSFPLLIDIANPDHLLAPGMSARVDVELENGEVEALVVPRDAVVTRVNGDRIVWRVEGQGDGLKAGMVRIRTGKTYRDDVEVVGDTLKEGDRIVMLGNENLRPGAPLRLLDAASPQARR